MLKLTARIVFRELILRSFQRVGSRVEYSHSRVVYLRLHLVKEALLHRSVLCASVLGLGSEDSCGVDVPAGDDLHLVLMD
jgi:hypothetical protein